ncbi:MAG: hypothetical protein KKC14_02995 [Alphaproteobacteria bacterium]|nr:hypothetical protein [Alphaproteobacteria bacterium]
MTDITTKHDGSSPGVLGDESQAQDLGQAGHPENRVTEADVKEAFQKPDGSTEGQAEAGSVGKKYDQLAGHLDVAESRQEALIDESLEESFPASDPPSAKHIT